MEVFRSTVIRLPGTTHNELLKIFNENRVNEAFQKKLRKNPKAKVYSLGDESLQGSEINYIHTKNGQSRCVAVDCRSDSTESVPCWHCRERRGFRENGAPIEICKSPLGESEQEEVQAYGYFCSENCMYAFIKERCVKENQNYSFYKNAITNAQILHKLRYPDRGMIKEANPWELLKYNGGSLTYETWKKEDLKFEPLPVYNLSQISLNYIQK